MKVTNLNVPPIFFCFCIKKLKLERLAVAESRDKLYNVSSNAAYQQMYVAWFVVLRFGSPPPLFIF